MLSFRTITTAGLTLAATIAPVTAHATLIDYVATISVTNSSNNAALGYISTTPNVGIAFLTGSSASALTVSFTMDDAVSLATGMNLLTLNSSTPYSYLGLIQGRDSADSTIQPGSFHYLYLGTTDATPVGTLPQTAGNSYTAESKNSRTSESAVWTIDLTTGNLSPNWTNPDGSTPTTKLFIQSSSLYAGGDSSQFSLRYPAQITPYALSLNILSSTPQTAAVPEPATWAMMIGGFGLVGASMRRQRKVTTRLSYAA